ncbi:hypothetical protein OV203_31545 [Nannocystis sp. ILAH1]|uniref:hypothetical protein n=1 Tax=unclassified Nannocystis TaxID=2627009 RepID=UPI00226E4EF3|nr:MULTISPECIES: hypothetical protein [unclassified Nannocystis]MCY0991719.1 hypothetical protein [Nannocystis sp. ILAH1]MCY1067267.1 hypothetical protein [Nannocystis sp. RBIL2]
MAYAYSPFEFPWRSPLAPLLSALVAGCAPTDGPTSASSSTTTPAGGDCYYVDEIVLTPEEYALWSMGIDPNEVSPTTGATDSDATTAGDATDSTTASTGTESGDSTDSGTANTGDSTDSGDSTSAGSTTTGGVMYGDALICERVCEGSVSDTGGPERSDLTCSITPTGENYTVNCKWPASCGGRGHACVRSRSAGEGPDAGAQWLARAAHDEAASVHAFAALAAELARLGAPAELLAALAEAARDEERHAAQVTALARRRGAELVAPVIAEVPPRDLLALAVENAIEGCVYETWAALVATHQARAAQGPELRAVFAAIAADEARHADLAWALDTWLSGQLDDAGRRAVAAARRAAANALADALADAPEQAELLALGLPSPRAAVQLCAGLDAALWSQAA